MNVAIVLCFQNVIAILVSGSIILISGQKGGLTNGFNMDDMTVSLFVFGSTNFSNRAMKKVSYPLVLLSKSAKILPVIFVGAIRGVYTPSIQQYLIAFFITAGLLIFNSSKFEKGGLS